MNGKTHILVSELFRSIQGESTFAGWPCAFIRLAGCGHGCRYCDTAYAEEKGTEMDIEAAAERALSFGMPCIEVTGGEPLLQPGVYDLLATLCDRHRNVLLETGGFLPVDLVDPRVRIILDVKAPSSGKAEQNHPGNLRLALEAPERFEFKFVLASREDYLWATAFIRENGLAGTCTVLFGAVYGELDLQHLAAWIIEDRLPVRMQLQLHKYIWQPDTRGV